jgi:vacuolar-type H+-ATPase subunit C/Vma6
MAMQDSAGNLVTGKMSLKKLYQETYKERLSHKLIEKGWEEIQLLKESLFKERLKFISEQNIDDWDITQIKKVCTKLKSGKARDRDDLVFELFNPDVCGDDLTLSMAKMFSGIKSKLEIPQFLQRVAITSLYKNKGKKSDFSNQRGVFNVSKVRSILDKTLYETIDSELSY